MRHELRNHAVDAPECLCIHAEHAAPKHADEVDGDIHKGNDHRPYDHGAVHITAAAVADTAHDGLRQGNGERPHEQPLRDVERDGHTPLRRRGQHRRMRRAQIFQNRSESAARREDVVEQQNDTEHHHDRTAGVGERNRAEPADRSVDDDHDAKEHEPQLVGVARHRGEELRPADELCDHRGGEKEDDHERRDCRERV